MRSLRRGTTLSAALLTSLSALAALTTPAVAAPSRASVTATLSVAAPAATPAGVLAPPPDVAAPAVAADGEIPSLRTAMSRTFKSAGGFNRTTISTVPVNYQDSGGAWQKIDTTLTNASGGGWRPAGTAAVTSLPASLSGGEVTVGSGTSAVSFAVVGAAGTASTSGSTATYMSAFPGVTVTETALNTGVKEAFVIATASAPASFTEHATLPAGATMSADPDGGATVTGAGGVTLGTISTPTVSDANGATSTSAASLHLLPGGDLSLAVDPAWLNAPGRAFPVTLDPNYGVGGPVVDMIESGADANTNYYHNTSACVGKDPANGLTRRAVLKFQDIGVTIPRDAEIATGAVGLTVTAASGTSTYQVNELTQGFNLGNVNWNQADIGTNWATPGGDSTSNGQKVFDASTVNTGTSQTTFQIPWLQSWLDSNPYNNQGMLIEQNNESGSGYSCVGAGTGSQAPTLNIFWTYRTGIDPAMKYFTHSIDGHEKLNINLANGNLVDESGEFADNAPGVPLTIDRTYNSDEATAPWMNGLGWWTTPSDSGTYGGGIPNGPWGNGYNTAYYASALSGDDDQKIYAPGLGGSYYNPPGHETMTQGSGPTYVNVTDNNSQAVENVQFATQNQLGSITSRTGLTETIGHNSTLFAAGQDPDVTTVTDTAGRTYTYAYGSNGGYITGITGPTVNGAPLTTSYTYQGGSAYQGGLETPTLPNGELLTATDTGGGTTQYAYDSSNRINKITSPEGNIVTLTYNYNGQVTSITYITNVSAMTGDTYNFVYTQPTYTGGTGTTTVEDPLYNGSVSTTAHTTTYTWNPDDQVTLVTDALGRHRAATYDPNGDGLTETDGLSTGLGTGGGNTGTNVYDTNNNLNTSKGAALTGGPAGTTTMNHTMTSGPAGYQYLMNSSQDPQNNMTGYAYDTMGLENQTTLPASMGTTSTRYQGDSGVTCGAKTGEPCSSTDADGHTTSYGYDTSGNVTSVTPPAPLPATSSTPDALGRTVASTDGNANTTRYVYNGLGEVLMTELAGTTTCTTSNISAGTCVQATYDLDGRQLTLADGTGTTTYSYDLTGAQTGESEPGYYASTIGYDAAGNPVTFADDGGTVTYTYDAANTLTDVAEPGGNCVKSTNPTIYYATTDAIPTSAKCTALAHDPNAAVSALEYPGGQTISYTRDNDGRPTTITAQRSAGGTTFFSQTLTYQTTTAPGTDTALLQTLVDTDTGSTAYGYDPLNRLTSARVGSAAASTWTLDAQGNRLSYTPSGGTKVNYAYNPADQLCETGTATITTSYTGACTAGSPSGSNTRYTYDADGNQTGGALPAGATTLAYNTASQTTSSTTAGTTTPYSYGSTGQTQRHTAGGIGYASGLVAQDGQPNRITGGTTTNYITRLPDGTPISLRTQAGNTATGYYYTLDYQGSARRLTAAAATSDAGIYSYDLYGQTLINSSSTPVALNPVNYTGGTRDTTGVTKLGTRYYNPGLGRFTQADGSGKDPCTYAYAANNPVNANDPAGSAPCDITGEGASDSPEGTLSITVSIDASRLDDLAGGVLYITGYEDGKLETKRFTTGGFLFLPRHHEFEFETEFTDIVGYAGAVGLVGDQPCAASVAFVGVIHGSKY